ncbi:MAG: MXAN_2562 family outer membrane beta-barrel protein [Sandaracinaceae bacterium]
MRALSATVAASLALALGGPTVARADLEDWSDLPTYQPSPEVVSLELRAFGIHFPNLGSSFDDFFGGDIGPLLSAEVDALAFRIRYLGLFGVGAGVGWTHYSGRTRTTGGISADQNTSVELVPITVQLLLRFDTLSRELNIPLVITAKVGPDLWYWGITPFRGADGNLEGGQDGWSAGLRFAGQLALELDFLSPRDARRMDEDWGINHTLLFGEVYYSLAGEFSDRALPVGGFGFVTGLGLVF